MPSTSLYDGIRMQLASLRGTMTDCKQNVPGCTCSARIHSTEMSTGHAAGWSRFQRALCNIRRGHLLNSQDHRDAVHILGYGSESELKHLMAKWRIWHPALFEIASGKHD